MQRRILKLSNETNVSIFLGNLFPASPKAPPVGALPQYALKMHFAVLPLAVLAAHNIKPPDLRVYLFHVFS